MALDVRVSSAVLFVSDLDRSVAFYRELFDLSVASSTDTAALLRTDAGYQLFLRSMGSTVAHPLGGLGLQYLLWCAGSEEDLARCERTLKRLDAYRNTERTCGVTLVEGHDPDNIPALISYPALDQVSPTTIPARVYEW